MADWIWMPFEVVSGVSRGIGVLDEGGDVEGEGVVHSTPLHLQGGPLSHSAKAWEGVVLGVYV